MSSPFLNLFLMLVKAYLRLIKLLHLVLILASDLQQTTNRFLTTFLLFKIDLPPRLARLVTLDCIVRLFLAALPRLLPLAAVLSLSSVRLLHLKLFVYPRGPLRRPALCHGLIPSTIYKPHTRANSPGLLNISLDLSTMTSIKVAATYSMTVDFLGKPMRTNTPHATLSPTLMRFRLMKMIG